MDKTLYNILLIDNNKEDVILFEEIISESKDIKIEVDVVSTLTDAFAKLKVEQFDVVLTDLGLPDSKGLETSMKLIEKYPHLPIIVLTGLNDDETGMSAIGYGAQDYIVKGNFNTDKILQTIRYSYHRKKLDNELRESINRFKSIAENIQDGLTIIENNEITYINSRMIQIMGYNLDELNAIYQGKSKVDINLTAFFRLLNDSGDFYSDESIWIKRKDGRRAYLRFRITVQKTNRHKIIKYLSTTDITDQWRNETIKSFVNKITSSANIVNNEKEFFKIIYKEVHKIFNDKYICLGIIKNTNIDFLKIEDKKVVIDKFPVKECMCNVLLDKSEVQFYSERELLDFKENENVKIMGAIPKSWMGASLYNNQKKHGFLIIKDFKNENAFNKDDLELLILIARQITLAIQKSKNEEKIHQLSLSVEQSPAAVEIADVDGNIEYVNERFTEITGYKKEEVLGKNPKILKSGKTTPKTYLDLWQTLKSRETWKGIFINRKKSGEIYYEEAKISPILNHNNEITHYVAIKEDISDRIDKEKELLEAKECAEKSERKVKDLLVEMQMKNTEISELLAGAKKILELTSFEKTAQILFDSCKRLTGAKSGYVALLSETHDENNVLFLDAGGDDCSVDPNLPMPIRGLREQAYLNKEVVYHNDFNNSEWVKYLPKGHVIMKNVLFAPLIIKNKAVGVIGLANKASNFTDADARIISAFGELASLALFNSMNIEELKKAKEKAEESDQLKSSFLANLSHEIRTPMNGIIGFAQFLKNPELSHENKMRFISIINDSCQQLLSIVEDILEISKLETGQIEIINEEFDPEEIVNNIFINHQEICKQKGLELLFNKKVMHNRMLFADKTKVGIILKNLITNAIKFTHEGKIEIGYEENSDNIVFYVNDTGIGIEEDLKEKIFDRFRQAENTMARTYGGMGLGLAIAKGYIELMNGEIWVDSKIDQGSTFYFKIKYKNVKRTNEEIEMNDIQEPIINFNNATVLVVEDEEINYQYIKRVFNGLGVENILRAHNGKEAIEMMSKKNAVGLIMMDLKMPIVNGFEATKKIKTLNSKVPIIAQTALAIPGDKQKALDAGCDDYIPKPIDYDSLLNLIEKYIAIND